MRLGPKIALIFAVPIAGCSLFVSLDGLQGGADASDGGSDAFQQTDTPLVHVDTGAGNTDAGFTCPDAAGATMVNVGSFCIDSTETTNAQYEQFLGSSPPLSLMPSTCSFKSGYTTPSTIGEGADVPVRSIDWCDAYAFCAWAGKRLCGKVGGGPNPYDAYTSVSAQWYFACSGGGNTAYPYGNTYEAGICDDTAYGAGGPIPVKQASGCVGGFSGIYDMAGNVWEWEDSCESDGGPSSGDQCRCRGGTWVDGEGVTSCGYDSLQHFETLRGDPVGYNGIRCCSP